MKNITIAILREEKTPYDLRTPLTPEQCVKVQQVFPNVKVIVQQSPIRCFRDELYRNMGISVVEDISHADILLGVKEVPHNYLIANKTYLYFSHTIKKQPHNRKMLREILKKKIRLIDYETLVWDAGNRIIGFGRFAGIVGAHYAFVMWGKRNNCMQLKHASQCKDMSDLYEQYKHLSIPPMKIVLAGDGRVAHGVIEFMKKIKLHRVSQEEFLENEYDHPVYVQLRSEDYYTRKDNREWDKSDFYKHPQDYRSSFAPYYRKADVMINAVYWHSAIEPFFTAEEMKKDDFRIKIISDISCDIPGPIPSTLRSSTIDNPFFGYHPLLQKEITPFSNSSIDIQAVGNLPCELPVDASLEFGELLIKCVLPYLLIEDTDKIILNGTIAENGQLLPKYKYLTDYVV
jgi:saccharopine dehydrogenase (NAD+, L-lysine-forming)